MANGDIVCTNLLFPMYIYLGRQISKKRLRFKKTYVTTRAWLILSNRHTGSCFFYVRGPCIYHDLLDIIYYSTQTYYGGLLIGPQTKVASPFPPLPASIPSYVTPCVQPPQSVSLFSYMYLSVIIYSFVSPYLSLSTPFLCSVPLPPSVSPTSHQYLFIYSSLNCMVCIVSFDQLPFIR